MSEPFADIGQLESRWRPLSDDESARAEVLLADASAMIRREAPGLDDQIAAGDVDSLVPEMVACAMVRRAMSVQPDGDGIQSTTVSSGTLSRGVTFANPMGNLYLTKQERRMLGLRSRVAFSVDTVPQS